jgi:hypothetical protein
MKMRFALMSMFMLVLLPLRLEARPVYWAVVSEDAMEVAANLKELDTVIESHLLVIDDYFTKNDDLTLQPDQELIIRGGKGNIGQELDLYQERFVFANQPVGQKSWQLVAYGCYYKRTFGKDTTYVMLRSSRWQGERTYCHKELGHLKSSRIGLGSLSAEVKRIK